MKPGKKSSASLGVVPALPLAARPEPVAGLSDGEAALWREIVMSLPADWFRASDLPLLAAYCQAAAEHAEAARQIGEMGYLLTDGKKQYRNPLLQVRHAAALRMGALASKMRLCQSARYDKNKAASATAGAAGTSKSPTGNPPWLGSDKKAS